MSDKNGLKLNLGLDIGSISINTVLIDDQKKIIESRYDYCHGKPFHVLKDILSEIIEKYGKEKIGLTAITGTGGKQASELIGGHFVNEVISQSYSVGELYPHVKTVIEMGGEDSKLIFMETRQAAKKSNMCDFSMNSLCAAGTGSFLDQQAKRIGVSIEDEFGEMALKSENPPRIAGRCSVFAKSDMIHLQQIATPVHDIVAGLCFAVARNFKNNLARGKRIETPVIFQGGVSANAGMIRAFKEVLNLKDDELIIPEYYASMGAVGAVFHRMDDKEKKENLFRGTDELETYLTTQSSNGRALEPLKESAALYNKDVKFELNGYEKLEVYLGLDVGSLSTNVVLIDKDNNVVARRYLPTASKPLTAIRKGLEEIYDEVGEKVIVKAAATTGSGRYLTGDFIGADAIRNEITAQATAAIAYDSSVDTIFEIGGQDSKYISIENGIVVDFEMNKVCAAGTGSFLEEQAEKLDINIIEEFGNLGLSSKNPTPLGDRCTVFIESDLNSHQQKGATKENLVGGLAYSIVYNYLQKVVGNKKIGNKIFFQGGVTNNKAVVAAFEKVTGKQITVPPHFDVTGAIGAAILAREELKNNGKQTRFKGFDISKIPYTVDRFTCKSCSNQCEIRRVRIEGESKALFYGGRCEKYEIEERKGKGEGIPNLFNERLELLNGDYKEEEKNGKITIGIPRALAVYYQQFPFWRTYFEELGFQVVLSDPSDHHMLIKSFEILIAETCLPVELMHGHVLNLLEKKVDYIFTPFIVNAKAEKDNPTNNCNCPWVQSYAFMIKAALKDQKDIDKLLIPTLHFRYFGRVLNKELSGFMSKMFNISKSRTVKAIKKADEAQTAFETAVQKRGQEVLSDLPDDKESMVILGRPYNTGDPELNLSVVDKLINQNVLPIPIDFLPMSEANVFNDYNMMYWPNGQKIISAVKYVKKNPKLDVVYLGNFRCGPDSFLTHFVREEMKGKPYLHLEIDEHSADAGMITRFEAFLDSLRGSKKVKKEEEKIYRPGEVSASVMKDRVLYFPYMCDAAYAVAAAVRHFGTESYVLPMQNERDIELGRKYTSSNECFPMICTLGSFLKKMEDTGVDSKKISFFMPDHNGPCRFGQYNKLQKLVFNRLGYQDVQFISPSNDNAYEDLSGGKGSKFTLLVWRGSVAVDILRKMKQETRPYELVKGETNKVYKVCLDNIVASVETGGKDLDAVLKASSEAFRNIKRVNGIRKPVIAIVGEIFMRDNPHCSSYLVDRLEKLGAETLIAPFSEWLIYSTYRYTRDSLWKGDYKGVIKSKITKYVQNASAHKLHKAVGNMIDIEKEVSVDQMLVSCNPYVHKDYDGDPAITFGAVAELSKKGISGIVHILPFTCMPGTLITSVSPKFRKDHNNIPWENIAYDGQDDSGIEVRLQAFMHQAKEYAVLNEHTKHRVLI
ncbi:MAG: acyl-CoA dehydratase activase [Bacteroidales bacterium]|nr:acyl-CoA dehydratase activase [Bacteroidales bacterium]